jgi:hypothetical protein
MTLDDFFDRIERENAERPGTHTLHAGLEDAEIDAWKSEHPDILLPPDLVALLKRSNGCGLHQDWYDGEPTYDEGAFVFLPLAEIKRADEAMYGQTNDDLPNTWMAFGIGPDSTVFFVFDADTLHYRTVAPIVPDESEDLGTSIEPILDMVFEGGVS